MKADRFFELLQNIDKKLIARAAKRRNNNKAIIIRMVAFAACLAIVVTGGVHIMLSRAPKVSALAVAEYPEQVPYPTADFKTDYELYKKQKAAWNENKFWEYDTDPTGNADYVKKLVSSLLEDDGKNKVVSPANIYFALAMLCETTNGNSQKQILDLLGRSDVESLRENSYILWRQMYSDDGHTTSILANSLWLNENCAKNYKQSTFDILKDKYFASAYSGDFTKEQYITTIRDWINEQTGGLLKDNVEKLNFSPETVMALVSTIYYKAPWQNEFIVSNTKRGLFHTANGDVGVDFMNCSSVGNVYYSDNFVSASKALEEGYMHFILPDEGYTVDDILKDEKALELISQNYSAVENKGVIVNLSVPKFDVSFDTDLAPSLKKLGVTDVFEMGKADFSPVGDVENMFISKAEHAARLKIDETGVEAAAYTAMGLCGGGIPDDEVDFVLDRPFIFVITGCDNLPLFVGIVNNP